MKNWIFLSAALLVAGCSQNQQTVQSELQGGIVVSEAAIAAYSANPKANKAVVCHMQQLLTVAQNALTAWENAPAGSTTEQQALSAAEAALTAYIANPVPPTGTTCT